jgi:hypothetical protein
MKARSGFICLALGLCLGVLVHGCTRQSPQQPTPQDAHGVAASPKVDAPDEGPASGGEPCGPVKCAADEVCCNASCGICTLPGNVCTQQFCEPSPVPIPEAATSDGCSKDADCSLSADYCKGCDCRALGPKESLPACAGPGVRCFADPCMKKVAVCNVGRCEVSAKP